MPRHGRLNRDPTVLNNIDTFSTRQEIRTTAEFTEILMGGRNGQAIATGLQC